MKISRKSSSVDNYYNRHEIIRDSIIVNNKTPRSIKATTIGYEKVFNEPKKLIVSQLISISGKSKVYAPIEVPGNTKEFIIFSNSGLAIMNPPRGPRSDL